MAKEELLTLESFIDEVLSNGRFGVTLDSGHRITAYTAGKMRRFRIRSVAGDRVHVEMTPYDLSKGRITLRERRPGKVLADRSETASGVSTGLQLAALTAPLGLYVHTHYRCAPARTAFPPFHS